MPNTIKDITGNKYGKLTAVSFVGLSNNGVNNRAVWKFICDCGNSIVKPRNEITRKRRTSGILSCGCAFKDNISNAAKKPVGYAASKSLYLSYKSNALRRRYAFELLFDQFLVITQQSCYYCGCAPTKIASGKKYNGDYTYNGIDRKDNTQGYTVENSLPCCWVCNKLKNTMGYDEFMQHIQQIARNHGF